MLKIKKLRKCLVCLEEKPIEEFVISGVLTNGKIKKIKLFHVCNSCMEKRHYESSIRFNILAKKFSEINKE